jgi:hypothetical protein
MNAPDPPPIGSQTHILGCFELFYYCMNFGAKCAELDHLMQRFME